MQLLLAIGNRGRDAAGYAYVNNKTGAVHIAKAPVTAEQFVRLPGHLLSTEYQYPQEFEVPGVMILHTRAATQGNPNIAGNNHPIYTKGSGLCLVHNGWVANDEALVKEHELTLDDEVDSGVLLKLIEHFYLKSLDVPSAVNEAMKVARGSFACAMIKAKRSGELWIWRGSGDLAVGETDFGYVFASTEAAVLRSVFQSCKVLDFSYVDVNKVAADSLLRLRFKRRGVEMSHLDIPVRNEVYEVTWDGTRRKRKLVTPASTTGGLVALPDGFCD